MYFRYHIPHFHDLYYYHVDYLRIIPSKIVPFLFYRLFYYFKTICFVCSQKYMDISTQLVLKYFEMFLNAYTFWLLVLLMKHHLLDVRFLNSRLMKQFFLLVVQRLLGLVHYRVVHLVVAAPDLPQIMVAVLLMVRLKLKTLKLILEVYYFDLTSRATWWWRGHI